MIYGLIIAAGKQSRFKSEMPKALVDVHGKCLLDLNIERLGLFCNKVYVVCSTRNESYFDEKYNKIIIESGFGSGDAIQKALSSLELSADDSCFIQWGDCLIDSEVYKLTLQKANDCNNTVFIPCCIENSPYVQIIPTEKAVSVKFSKYGDFITEGFHDNSVFYSNCKYLLRFLNIFKRTYFDHGKYSHIHGNEYEFLDTFNDTNIRAKVVDTGEYSAKAFNTIEELKSVF